MKEYAPQAIRNVVFASHSGSGKTSLQEACLFLAGSTDRMGKVEDGNTVSDYLPDEIKRHSSISDTLLAFEYKDTKFNFIDSPGYIDFFGEVCVAMSACENAVLVANGTAGIEIGMEAAARRELKEHLACFIFINQLDKERSAFDPIFDQLRSHLHLPAVAIAYPLGTETNLRGYIDVVENKAYEDNAGKLTEVPIPAACEARVAELRQGMIETLVECDDAAMEKYLEGGEIASEELHHLLKQCVTAGKAVPVLCGSATKLIGVKHLLDTLQEWALAPNEAPAREVFKDDEVIALQADPAAPFAGYVFKTFSDPFMGRQTFIKVVSGTLKKDADIVNLNHGNHEKLAHLYTAMGKKQSEVNSVQAGDIVLVNKLKQTTTGDTLTSNGSGPTSLSNDIRFHRPELPHSLFSLSIEPVTHGDDDKLSDALAKLLEEDQTFHVERNANTGQTVISGLGDIHLSTLVGRLKSSFGVDVRTSEPKVAYRETICKKVKYEGKLKKQSGGHGQFADAWLELEPGEPGSGFEFIDKIVGGVVPRSFIPAVEEGVREALREGPLAGYPMVDLKVTLFDGKYHDVDSSFQTFKVAGSMGLRGGAKEAGPVLLEPIMMTTIEVPEGSAGDVMGDLNSRRGQILSMEPTDHGTVCVKAYIPDAELLRYPIVLRSLTHGRGVFDKEFDHYSAMPDNVARPIIEDYQKRRQQHE
jgi:elongation factor G